MAVLWISSLMYSSRLGEGPQQAMEIIEAGSIAKVMTSSRRPPALRPGPAFDSEHCPLIPPPGRGPWTLSPPHQRPQAEEGWTKEGWQRRGEGWMEVGGG